MLIFLKKKTTFILATSSWDLLEERIPSINSCRVIFPSWSLSILLKKSITRDFLWFIQRMYFLRQTSKSKLANSLSWKGKRHFAESLLCSNYILNNMSVIPNDPLDNKNFILYDMNLIFNGPLEKKNCILYNMNYHYF